MEQEIGSEEKPNCWKSSTPVCKPYGGISVNEYKTCEVY